MTSLSSFDVIIIGGGATGGWAAKLLTEHGLTVCMVEAGRPVDGPLLKDAIRTTAASYSPPPATLSMSRPIQSACYRCRDPLSRWFINDEENPYTQEKPFSWIRMRTLGGRLSVWEGQCYRMSPYDFSPIDGLETKWPFEYQHLAPYYSEAEQFLKVVGREERWQQIPDGVFVRPTGTNTSLLIIEKAAAKRTVSVTPARIAAPPPISRLTMSARMAGCSERAYATMHTNWQAISDAHSTGRLTVLTSHLALEICSARGQVRSVTCLDFSDSTRVTLDGKIVVLCASTLESTKLLMSSGLGSSSELLGHNLMDHVFGGGATGVTHVLRQDYEDAGNQRHRAYIPRCHNIPSTVQSPFHRGYGLQVKAVPTEHPDGRSLFFGWRRSRYLEMRVTLTAFGECLPRHSNYVTLNRAVLDSNGMPTLTISFDWSSNELAMMSHSQTEAEQVLEAAGCKQIALGRVISTPGLAIHEVGTARMGVNPDTGVLNQFGEVFGCLNLFVLDGSGFVSNGCQNPTLTLLALCGRSCREIIQRFGS